MTMTPGDLGRITTVITIVGGMLVLGAFALVALILEAMHAERDLEEAERAKRERDRETLAQMVRIDAGLEELDAGR